jgi:hypothetical protein
VVIVTTRERQRAAREGLDETDVEPFPPSEAASPSDVAAPTTEDLEEQLEDGTPGPEEQALHPEDAATEVLDDERDAEDGDLRGETGEELQWRMASEHDEDIETRRRSWSPPKRRPASL